MTVKQLSDVHVCFITKKILNLVSNTYILYAWHVSNHVLTLFWCVMDFEKKTRLGFSQVQAKKLIIFGVEKSTQTGFLTIGKYTFHQSINRQ